MFKIVTAWSLKGTFSVHKTYKNFWGWSPCGLVVMTRAYWMERQWFKSAARRMLLSQKGFEYVTMNLLLPAKAVDCQPTLSHSEMRCKDLGQAIRIQTSFNSKRRLTLPPWLGPVEKQKCGTPVTNKQTNKNFWDGYCSIKVTLFP